MLFRSNAATQQASIIALQSNAGIQADAIAGANASIVTANTAMKSYVDAVTTAWTANAASQDTQITNLWANAGAQATSISTLQGQVYANTNVASYLGNYNGSINFVASPAIISGVGSVTTANLISGGFFWSNGAPFTSSNYGNTQVAAYLIANPQAGTYSNTNVAAYLTASPVSSLKNGSYSFTLQPQGYLTVPTSQYGTAQMFSTAGVSLLIGTLDSGNYWQFKTGGIIQFPDNSQQTTAYPGTGPLTAANAQISTLQANIGSYYIWANANVAGLYNSITGANSTISQFQANVGSFYTWANSNFGTSSYGNTQVAQYLPVYTGNSSATRLQTTSSVDFMYGGYPYFAWQITDSNTLKLRVNISTGDVNTDLISITRQSPQVVNVFATLSANSISSIGTATVANVITTNGVFWANGVAYSSGGGTYGNTDVAAYLTTTTVPFANSVSVTAVTNSQIYYVAFGNVEIGRAHV